MMEFASGISELIWWIGAAHIAVYCALGFCYIATRTLYLALRYTTLWEAVWGYAVDRAKHGPKFRSTEQWKK